MKPIKMNPFKICPKCSYTWKARDDFLADPFLCLVGFQADFNETEAGHYLFNHILADNRCNTTLAVEVEDFFSIYEGHVFAEIKFGSPACEEHCSNVDDLAQCPIECKNAIARKIMQTFSHCEGLIPKN